MENQQTATTNKNNLVQICKIQNDKKLIEAMDCLNIEKVLLRGLDYTNRDKKAIFAQNYISTTKLIRIANRILTGRFEGTAKPDGSIILFSENKINGKYVDENGLSPTSRFAIYRNGPNMSQRYKVYFDNGVAKAAKKPNGATFIAKGTYKSTSSVTVFISEDDMEEFLIDILRTIRRHDIKAKEFNLNP